MPSAPRTVLIVGATGNTGRSVICTLSSDLAGQDVRILGLTRSIDSNAAKALASLPLVEMEAKNWPEISAAWLQKRNVVKAFVASHNEDSQFTDESLLLVSLLEAGVEHVVRISTFGGVISPTSPVYYGQTHWAIERMLAEPAYNALKWTSLRPNLFSTMFLTTAAEAVKIYRSKGELGTLKMLFGEDIGIAAIDPDDVGTAAGKLLALADPTPHASQIYTLNGPDDITGKAVTAEVERLTGAKVTEVTYQDQSWLDHLASSGVPAKTIPSLRAATDGLFVGNASLARVLPTSQAILDLAPPKRTFRDSLGDMVSE